MGDFRVRPITGKEDRARMYHYALNDIRAFERMWNEKAFVDSPIHIGAEQELCLVNEYYEPSKSALKLLDKINDPHYTNELGLFNLEINLDPIKLSGNCFSTTEKDLLKLLTKGKSNANTINEKLLMTGILPTISPDHLHFDYMTPIPRYKTLSQMLYNIRGGEFEIYIQGVDELIASLGSVLFEACNTSFQMHLQLKPEEFVDKFNWSQMIAGPVLSACVNSPLLFGRELWAESRIALFKQSLDTRSSKNHLRKKLPRVYFGDSWLYDSPVNLWKNELTRFPLLLTSDDFQDANEALDNGITPDLRGIRLHTGTAYTWNRLCYGPGDQAHLRIECRYLPAGPTPVDEIANFAFWVGLMNAIPDNWNESIETISFKNVKDNFIKSARNGLNSVFNWFGRNIPAKQLIYETLLPMAEMGLKSCNVDLGEIDKYLDIIEQRVLAEQTGANWQINNYRTLKEKSKTAIQDLVAEMISYQHENIPVHLWDNISKVHNPQASTAQSWYKVSHLMSTDIFAVNETSSIDIVKSIMEWNNIHHLPVEDQQGNLAGIITDGVIKNKSDEVKYASDVMIKDVISVDENTLISDLKTLLKKHQLSGVPVVRKKKIVGMITTNDLSNS